MKAQSANAELTDSNIDYGTPPMKDAHAFVKSSSLGPQINFLLETDAAAHLPSSEIPKYDAVVLSMSIWYFHTLSHILVSILFKVNLLPKKCRNMHCPIQVNPQKVILRANYFNQFQQYVLLHKIS